MKADGSKPVNVTRHPGEEGIGMFVWSPDSRRIAFISMRDGNEEVYVVEANGDNISNLSRSPAMGRPSFWFVFSKTLKSVINSVALRSI